MHKPPNSYEQLLIGMIGYTYGLAGGETDETPEIKEDCFSENASHPHESKIYRITFEPANKRGLKIIHESKINGRPIEEVREQLFYELYRTILLKGIRLCSNPTKLKYPTLNLR